MRLQLDTERKTIKLDEDVQLDKLIDLLEKLLPKGEWKKFKLETNVTIKTWYDFPVIKYDHYHPRWDWYTSSTLKAVSTTADMKDTQLKSGVFNVEL
jgi:hypothetical protein